MRRPNLAKVWGAVSGVLAAMSETVPQRIASNIIGLFVLSVMLGVLWSFLALFRAVTKILGMALLALLICSGCSLDESGLSSGPFATCDGRGVKETRTRTRMIYAAAAAALAGCTFDYAVLGPHPSVDGGIDAGARDVVVDAVPSAVPDAAQDRAAGALPDVVRDAAAADRGVSRDLSRDVLVCGNASNDMKNGGVCLPPYAGTVWVDGPGKRYNCVASSIVSRTCWTWDLFDGQVLTYVVPDCSQCRVEVTP